MTPPRDDLRLLSIFHYLLAGLTLLFSCFPLAYVGMGLAAALGAFDGGGQDALPAVVGWVFVAFGLFLLLLVVADGVGLLVAGRSIARQKHWLFCMIMAGISCAFFPFGTALGMFTLVTLSKPEVKALFTARPTELA